MCVCVCLCVCVCVCVYVCVRTCVRVCIKRIVLRFSDDLKIFCAFEGSVVCAAISRLCHNTCPFYRFKTMYIL